ncbi:tetratricopeptide (TPR) repeat protein [Geomicrobium halophilum]|uniref:Tetratricopeptide (TPR) repeat protein n=1 Tax=Geomicrobium halophilum TaxID=549000 RepID=A0A841PRE6_9BACL|nr:tetratricopeptide repeat protein [Geomicrobium halophilum]MBB6450384.1 tetratricopeptide (TPR) repeat protein [Geomicrobium halophilum]
MKRLPFVLLSVLLLSACSTYNMEQHIAEEETINIETYGYDDDSFHVDAEALDQLADKIRLEELSTTNINSVIDDEINNGLYNEFIVFFHDQLDNDPENVTPFFNKYYDALVAHVKSPEENSEPLVADALDVLEEQYNSNPENDEHLIRYAQVLMESGHDVEEGANLILEWKDELEEGEVDNSGLLAIAQAHYHLEEYEESINVYNHLAANNPDEPMIYYLQSQVYQEAGQTEAAQHTLEEAFEPSQELIGAYGDSSYDFFLNVIEGTD